MKNYIYITFACFTLLLGCKREDAETFKISGRLLESCDNPRAVRNEKVILSFNHSLTKLELIESSTDNNGYFEFEYEKKALMDDLTIKSNLGFGYRNLMYNIPKNKSISIGDLFYNNNLKAIVRVITDSVSSKNDTVFYDYLNNKFRKFIVGPFNNKHHIDTINAYNIAEYNDFNNHKVSITYFWKSNIKSQKEGVYLNEIIDCNKFRFIDLNLNNKLK